MLQNCRLSTLITYLIYKKDVYLRNTPIYGVVVGIINWYKLISMHCLHLQEGSLRVVVWSRNTPTENSNNIGCKVKRKER